MLTQTEMNIWYIVREIDHRQAGTDKQEAEKNRQVRDRSYTGFNITSTSLTMINDIIYIKMSGMTQEALN